MKTNLILLKTIPTIHIVNKMIKHLTCTNTQNIGILLVFFFLICYVTPFLLIKLLIHSTTNRLTLFIII